ncbi:MAG: 4-hydroxy-tetrahydrodipicolinate reductase [Rickettsiales bacterium]
MTQLTLAIAGCTGRMGQALIATAHGNKDVKIVAGGVRNTAKQQAAGLFVTSEPAVLAGKAEAVIDFTTPETTLALAREVAKTGGIIVIGTTGFSDGQQKKINECAATARIVQSGNFSLGVNILESLVERTAMLLNEQYDIEISEMHHRYKKDAPSGTALMLGHAAAKGRNVSFDNKKMLDHGGERKIGDIGFASLRGGDVVGIHNVMFAGNNELITLSHQGFSRTIFATGAITAALWARDKKPGIYSMRDVIGL